MEDQIQIKIVKTETEIDQCWDVAFLLRPHLKRDKWVSMVTEMMKNERYFIAGIFQDDKFAAFAGYRFMTSLHTGNIIYIDDLCTLDAYRGKGFASRLIKYVREIARMNQLDALVLDTDFTNSSAQKVYLKSGFQLAALHLAAGLRGNEEL
ncbi:GNAT family N-acetyltransferase [Dyadobacter aurulentus]|uniref:GNAT family N-acetyltransferase n=1 Tax=Dyadobacter sp. UC 10 TaxID=2605428 RepID=UPI001788C74D|nr:GNAT family N-acetyltransferase [Dyadobacter sp. UC 10]